MPARTRPSLRVHMAVALGAVLVLAPAARAGTVGLATDGDGADDSLDGDETGRTAAQLAKLVDDEPFEPLPPAAPADDVLDGGDGNDALSYSGRTQPLRVDLADPAADGSPGEADRLMSIEDVNGGYGPTSSSATTAPTGSRARTERGTCSTAAAAATSWLARATTTSCAARGATTASSSRVPARRAERAATRSSTRGRRVARSGC